MSKKILIITEGQEEERLFSSIVESINELMDEDYEIVKFNNPIYELYELIKDDKYFDIVHYLQILYARNNKEVSNDVFSQVYLVFDYDPQYHKYSDEIISEMLKVFNNETENGKLYINYPMVEAAYHLRSEYDKDFYTSRVELDKISSDNYKKLVNSESYIQKSNLNRAVIKNMIKQHYLKTTKILNIDFGIDIDYQSLLNMQIELKNTEKQIYILATVLLMVYDHNHDQALKLLSINKH